METPQFIGKYEVLGRLGAGGMAKVFLARRSGAAGFEKKVAIKRLATHKVEDEVLIRSLINEARLVAQLSHQNLVQVLEFELIERAYCMAMEYIDGMTLDGVMDKCAQAGIYIPTGLVVYIALEVCAGLDYAHFAKGEDGKPLKLVHRDIKPANIMISRQGQVKIMDFGIAKASTNAYKTTAHGGVKGTLAYMSPEQLSGEQDLQPTSDLYSFGLVLYEMATLQRLYDDSNLFKLAANMQEGLNADARARLTAVYPELVPIVSRLLNFYPDQRYPDARALMYELRPLAFNTGALELAEFLKDLDQGMVAGRYAHTVASSPSLIPPRHGGELLTSGPGVARLAGSGSAWPVPARGSTEALPSEALMAFGTAPSAVGPTFRAGGAEASRPGPAPKAAALSPRVSQLDDGARAREASAPVPAAGAASGAGAGGAAALARSDAAPSSPSASRTYTYTRRHLVAAGVVGALLVISGMIWLSFQDSADDPAGEPRASQDAASGIAAKPEAGGAGREVAAASGAGTGETGPRTPDGQALNAAGGLLATDSAAVPKPEGGSAAGTGSAPAVAGAGAPAGAAADPARDAATRVGEGSAQGKAPKPLTAKAPPSAGRGTEKPSSPRGTGAERPSVPAASESNPASEVAQGRVRLFAIPWAQVYVDGARVGEVPFTGALKAGSHTVRLVTAEGAEKSFSITVKANEETRKGWNFDSAAWME